MIRNIVIDKSKLSKKPVGCILGSEADNDRYDYKNIVVGYIYGQSPILIKTNLSQQQWELFCDGKLSKKELDKYV